MTKQQFPDLTYPLTKMYDGINRQDYAELSALLVARVRDDLQAFKPQISSPADKKAYDDELHSAMQALELLEEYYKKFNSGERRTTKSAVKKLHSILLKEIEMLKHFSNQ